MMDNNRFINLETFEVIDEVPNFIVADKLIAETIAILNQKGYKTTASCSGHFYKPTMWMQENVDIDFLEKAKNDPLIIISEIRENDFDCWVEHRIADVYILFDKKYDFQVLPEGFEKKDCTLRGTVEFFIDNKRRSEKEINDEIIKYNDILKSWAKNLPKIN